MTKISFEKENDILKKKNKWLISSHSSSKFSRGQETFEMIFA